MNVVTCSASSISGINNFGDELLTELYAEWIRECDPSIRVTHVSVSQYGALSRTARESIEAASCLVFTGGGYFADGDFGSRHRLRRQLRALRNRGVYRSVFEYARRRNVPCAVVGLEVGPIKNPLYRSSVKEILRSARVVVVRNQASRANAEQICGHAVAPLVHLDAALAVSPSRLSSIELDDAVNGCGPDEVRVGFHLHSVDDELDPTVTTDAVGRIVSSLSRERPVRLFYIHDQRKSDAHPSRSVRAQQLIAESFPDTRVLAYRDPFRTAALIGTMDLVVTTKLHVGIVARALDIPVLALGGHPKIRRFYKSIGEEETCVGIEDLRSNGIPQKVARSVNGEGRGCRPLGETLRESALRNRDVVQQLMESLLSQP